MDGNVIIVSCPACGRKYRVPSDRGKLEVTCKNDNCKRVFFYEPDDYYSSLLQATKRKTQEKNDERARENMREAMRKQCYSKSKDDPIDGYELYIKDKILEDSKKRTSGTLKGYLCKRRTTWGTGMDAESPPYVTKDKLYNYSITYGGKEDEEVCGYTLTHRDSQKEFSVNEANKTISELKNRLSRCGFKKIEFTTSEVIETHFEAGLFKNKEVKTVKPNTVYIHAEILW